MNRIHPKASQRDTGYTEFIDEPIIFDGFLFPRFPSVFCFADGMPGRRSMFISCESERYTISFDERMKCMDVNVPERTTMQYISSEYRSGDRYIHQLRTDPATRPGAGNYAFFHMKIPDENGEIHILPGQMTAKVDYQWSDEVEPILKALLMGIAVCKVKGGGTS